MGFRHSFECEGFENGSMVGRCYKIQRGTVIYIIAIVTHIFGLFAAAISYCVAALPVCLPGVLLPRM